MQRKTKSIIKILSDLLITGAVFSVFFFEENDYVYYFGVFLFCTSSYGLIAAIFAPIKQLSENGFRWKYYLTTLLQIIILVNTKFWFIGCMFSAVAMVVLVKNLIGMKVYRDDQIYIKKRSI
jgi:hypothetical protein